MQDLSSINLLLEETGRKPNGTRNREGDLYLFEKGLKEYIGSAALMSSLRFYIVGESVPKETTRMKNIEDVLGTQQIDDLYAYIPYTACGKLVVPIPVSGMRADSLGYKYYGCRISGPSIIPDVFEMNNGILCTITSLFDGEDPSVMLTIYSYWTYVNNTVYPAILSIHLNLRKDNLEYSAHCESENMALIRNNDIQVHIKTVRKVVIETISHCPMQSTGITQ